MKNVAGYYFITDSTLSRKGTLYDVEQACKAGVSVIQYRQKIGSTLDLLNEALLLRKMISPPVLFLVNDRVDIASAVYADGVHLGQDDMPCKRARQLLGSEKIIGVTVHTVEEAEQAVNDGADYLGVSPIFSTSTKEDAGIPAGIGLLRNIRTKCSLPLVAIGGITLENAEKVISAGADSICAISAVVSSSDVYGTILAFQSLFQHGSE